MKVAILAPSSVVPAVEFAAGLQTLKRLGAEIEVLPSCNGPRDFVFSASEEARIRDFENAAWSDAQVVWAARGGYGALRLLPRLIALDARRGKPPKKVFVGFSDCSALLDFLKDRWGWDVFHGPMIAMSDPVAAARYLKMTYLWIREGRAPASIRLKVLRPGSVQGRLRGGNLTVLTAMTGTPYARNFHNDLLFLEDVAESPSRLERCLAQLELSGRLQGVAGILVGDFFNCDDVPPTTGKSRRPIRPKISTARALGRLFGDLSDRLRCPAWAGVPFGHGKRYLPLPVGEVAQVDGSGVLSF